MSSGVSRINRIGVSGGIGVLAILGVGFVHFYLRFFGNPEYAVAPKIKYLFILNAVFAVVYIATFVWRPHWVLAGVGIGFALATMGSYLYSRYNSTGLFLFKEPKIDGWGWASLACEAAAALCLAAWALTHRRRRPMVLATHQRQTPTPIP